MSGKYKDIEEVIDSLSPIERKIIPFLGEKDFDKLLKSSGIERVSVLRALEFLSAKGIVELEIGKKKVVEIGENGKHYLHKGLPERRLLNTLEKGNLSFNEAGKKAGLDEQEFKAALGALKKRALIEIKNGVIILTATKKEIDKKTLEEVFLESLPREFDDLKAEEKFALNSLRERKDLIEINDKQIVKFSVLEVGKELMKKDLKHGENLIEQLTGDMIRSGSWEGKKFRKYNVESSLPSIYGGKRHFVNQATDYARKAWAEMGFKEMSGDMVVNSFWVFDSLFTAQDHPVREMQDTFFINKKDSLPDKKIVDKVRKAHEGGLGGSKGWQYSWDSEIARKLVLRTHTTSISSKTLTEIDKTKLPMKFFAIGRCFRNETVDWKHGFEFNQTEGIVVDRNVNFRHLLGYLTEFFKKMGFEKIRIRPSYFAYTEPSVEIDVYHPEKKIWLELGGAGIFRPEVTLALFGEEIPVLAWGPGLDRMLMNYYEVKDLRELYKNDIKALREMKFWKE